MEDANPVSIITERVSDTEQRLWTSGFKNVQVYRHRHGESKLEVRGMS
jgi:helix-turn-helix protein